MEDIEIFIDDEDSFDFEVEEDFLIEEIDTEALETLEDLNIIHCKWYQFQIWKDWKKEIENASVDFHREFKIFPNIILVCKSTYSKIIYFINSTENVILSTKEKKRQEGSFIPIGIFESRNFALEFCVDDSIEKKGFLLIYDSEPNWLESGIPIEENRLYEIMMDI
ncbi:MAG: hypothetical protein KDK36_20155 [Leptospiraceae bacterium]|nr:hypothetical protein [Leptospiraceae bacterium]